MSASLIKTALLEKLNLEILPALSGAEAIGLLLTGSRATGTARMDSDLDALVVIRSKPEMEGPITYLGHLCIQDTPIALELKLIPEGLAMNLVPSEPLHVAGAIAQGNVLLDPHSYLSRMQAQAHQRLGQEVQSLMLETLPDSFEPLLGQVQFFFAQAQGVLTNPELSGDSVAKITRFSEYLLDYFVSVQKLLLSRSPWHHAEFTRQDLDNLVFAQCSRGARFLNSTKNPTPLWFQNMSQRLSRIWDAQDNTIDEKLLSSLGIMEETFLRLIGAPLRPDQKSLSELLLLQNTISSKSGSGDQISC